MYRWRGCFHNDIRQAVHQVHFRIPSSKVATYQYESSTRPGSKVESTAPARKSQLLNAKVVRKVSFRCPVSNVAALQYESSTQEVNFRSPASKVATFQNESSTRGKHQKPSSKVAPFSSKVARGTRFRSSSSKGVQQHAGGPVGRPCSEGNWRGGPSTLAKLSRILRQ